MIEGGIGTTPTARGPVLGFVAPDGEAQGRHRALSRRGLTGKWRRCGARTGSGRLIFEGGGDERALQGDDVTISLDEGIQHVAERELDAAMRTYETKGASIVVADPSTGEILALASFPGYNPNDYSESEPDPRRDRPAHRPLRAWLRQRRGSPDRGGKLNAGALSPTDTIDCEHGVYQIGGVTIHDTHINDLLTPTQILASQLQHRRAEDRPQARRAPATAAFRAISSARPPAVPLPGEAAGVLRPKGRPWYDPETASASFGR